MRGFYDLLRRFRSDQRGAFGILFGVMAIVLVAVSGAVVDYTSMLQAKTRAQLALDSAALGLQARIYDNPRPALSVFQSQAQALLEQRLGDPSLVATVTLPSIDMTTGTLHLEATIVVPTIFVRLVGISSVTERIVSEATRGALDLEVALALDTTGSMAGQKILDLRTATNDLIDIIVQDVQTPTYTKLALVPYSMGVNVGGYAASVRGAIAGPKSITGASWASGSAKNITGATKANPVVITSNAHGFLNGDRVYISGVPGMTQLNNKVYIVASKTTNTFALKALNNINVDGRFYSTFSNTTPRGTATKCQTTACEIVITANSHGFANGDNIYITGVGGMTQLNNQFYQIGSVTTNTFVLPGVAGTSYSAYTSGGSSYCTIPGCQYYYFQNPSGNPKTFEVSTCVTERTTNPYTDAAPSTTPLGRNYPSSGNPCIAQTIVPLSTDKTALHATAAGLTASGSTGGHIGLAWAWYMVSPNFAYLWPTASQPASYSAPHLLKVVILMTDGAFNTVYYNGVISADSISGSGSSADHINVNAPNGSSLSQGLAQCTAMKAAGIIVYTVGFDIGSDVGAQNLMANCATDAAHAYLAATGSQLQDVFRTIAKNISQLRVSK